MWPCVVLIGGDKVEDTDHLRAARRMLPLRFSHEHLTFDQTCTAINFRLCFSASDRYLSVLGCSLWDNESGNDGRGRWIPQFVKPSNFRRRDGCSTVVFVQRH